MERTVICTRTRLTPPKEGYRSLYVTPSNSTQRNLYIQLYLSPISDFVDRAQTHQIGGHL